MNLKGLEILNKYVIELDSAAKRYIVHTIKTLGEEKAIDGFIHDMDCTRVYKDNLRPCQTTTYQYNSAISYLFAVLTHYKEITGKNINAKYKQEIIDRMIAQHNKNIAFELVNPPIVYNTKGKTVKARGSKPKIDKPIKEKKPTIAEMKLAAKAAKFNKLTVDFKIKAINKDDNETV